MAAGDATATDVPGRYDVVIAGKGFVFADSIDSSIPFRTHRAIYDLTPTFVERSNTSNQYGDQAQDFFLTASQNDWSLGEDQKFFRSTDTSKVRQYWLGSNVEVSIPGQVTIQKSSVSLTFGQACWIGIGVGGGVCYAAGLSNVYKIDSTGTVTLVGAHGCGDQISCMATDGIYVYLSGGSVTKTRKLQIGPDTISDFSTQPFTAMTFNNNTLYGYQAGVFYTVATTGTATSAFTWKDATGSAASKYTRLTAYAGKVAILRNSDVSGSELWVYDGTGVAKVAAFPQNFRGSNFCVQSGIIFTVGHEDKIGVGSRAAVWAYDGSTIERTWTNPFFGASAGAGSYSLDGGIAPFGEGLVFTDFLNGTLRFYDLGAGGISTLATYPAGPSTSIPFSLTGSDSTFMLNTGGTSGRLLFSTTTASSASVSDSLVDFESSLTKMFRGVKVDWTAATDGDGGSVDIAYQVDSLDGSYTSLHTGAVSGTEYLLTGVSGHAISVQVTLNKGTSTLGPTLKRVYVRAAPQLTQFRSGTYILDCTGDPNAPRYLRDNTPNPVAGWDQIQSLLTAAAATTPFTITDRLGSFTGLIDLSDPEGFDIYEVHPNLTFPNKSGSFLARIKCRQV